MSRFASQLALPHGVGGAVVARLLNRSNARAVAGAVEGLDPASGSVAADLGFGGGVGLGLLLNKVGPNGRVFGVDLSTEMVSRAQRHFRAETADGRLVLKQGSMTELPLEDGSIDGAITVNTVYFIAELEDAFREMARVLSAGGRCVVGIGDPENMARMPMTPYGFRLRPVDQVVTAAERAGLKLVDHARVGDGARAGHLLTFARQPRT